MSPPLGVRLTAGRGSPAHAYMLRTDETARRRGDRAVKTNICATTTCLRPECARKSTRRTEQSVFLRVLLLLPSSGRDWLTAPLTSPAAAAAAASASPATQPARPRPLNLPLPPTPPSIHPHAPLSLRRSCCTLQQAKNSLARSPVIIGWLFSLASYSRRRRLSVHQPAELRGHLGLAS